jgi:hypothetical protein
MADMRYEEIPDQLRCLAFEFFFKFSRLEYALKEARFLRDERMGANAEVSWERFIRTFENDYLLPQAGQDLLGAGPQRQIVGEHELLFRNVGFNPGASDLERIVRLANTVRNNLFHGGKHGTDYWDDPVRMQALLTITIEVITNLAEQAGLAADFARYY